MAQITIVRAVLLGAPVALTLLAVVPAFPQSPPAGSRTLALGHWAYEYVEQLRSRGYLSNLNPLVQPYRRLEVARGVASLDPTVLEQPVSAWVRLLREELTPELGRLAARASRHMGAEFTVGGRASTSQRLDPLRPTGDADAWPRFTAGGWIERGPFAAEGRLAGDVFLTHDPDGLDPGQIRGGRTDNAYASATFSVGGMELGRLKRNWSALGTHGFMVSDAATPYPQVALEARVGRLTLRSFTGELDTLGTDKRYLTAHRLDYQADNLVVSFGESFLYVPSGGQPALRYFNPLEFFFFDQGNQPDDIATNLMLDAQLWYALRGATFYLDWLLDDIDVIPGSQDPEPLLYAFRLGSRITFLVPWLTLSLDYRQVAAFAYRTPNVLDRYSFLGRGLGDNYSDYDRLTLSADLFPPVRGLKLSPMLQLQRQGEGNFRDPLPPIPEYLASPTIFLDTVETSFRLGLRGRYQPSRLFWFAWDVGQNFNRNAGHRDGINTSRFSGVAEFGATLELPLRR